MNVFPAVDPIPLPAPVWLFKALHVLTLSLHFIAVEVMLGGLLLAVVLSFLGAGAMPNTPGALRLNAGAALARRLPIVMTYVINLGVPPLLFAQVLYGRVFYTSSVLIGLYWISVIVLLTLGYWLLYQFSARLESGKSAWWLGLISWLIAASIAKIYVSNMTLMLRPSVWQEMYAASAAGIHLPPHDPASLPRWLYMICGGFVFAGLWMLWLSGRRCFEDPLKNYLSKLGGRMALAGVPLTIFLAYKVVQAQPAGVQQALAKSTVHQTALWLWLGAMGFILLLGLKNGFTRKAAAMSGWLAMVFALVASLGMTLYRDGIRDFTLAAFNYDVWSRQVVTNWPVVGLFLVLFVAGLATAGWLISVVMRARPVTEKVTP